MYSFIEKLPCSNPQMWKRIFAISRNMQFEKTKVTWTKEFYKDGSRLVTPWVDDKKHGKEYSMHDEHKREAFGVTRWVHGKKHGFSHMRNGNSFSSVVWTHGRKHGVEEIMHNKTKYLIRWRKGKKHGKEIRVYENKSRHHIHWNRGKKHGTEKFWKPCPKSRSKKGHRFILIEKIEWYKGNQHRYEQKYYANGNLKSRTTWFHGTKKHEIGYWSGSKNIKYKVSWFENKKHGAERHYFSDEVFRYYINWEHGKKTREVHYDT